MVLALNLGTPSSSSALHAEETYGVGEKGQEWTEAHSVRLRTQDRQNTPTDSFPFKAGLARPFLRFRSACPAIREDSTNFLSHLG